MYPGVAQAGRAVYCSAVSKGFHSCRSVCGGTVAGVPASWFSRAMLPLLSATHMQALDRFAIEKIGIPSAVLMEVAGRGVLDAVLTLLGDAALTGPVLLLAGMGNNGGDTVVVARHLAERGVPVTLLVLGSADKASESMQLQLRIIEALGVQPWFLEGEAAPEMLTELLDEAEVVVDGLFGTGLTRPIDDWRAQVIDLINDSDAPVVAVDIASGVSADTGQVLGVAVEADITVTFQCAKLGHVLFPGRALAGEVHIVDIGIPESRLPEVGQHATLLDERVVQAAFLPREQNTHKGTYGHVLVAAGNPDQPGAGLLAARAAQKTGAGLVTLASDGETVRRVGPVLGSLMGLTVGETNIEAKALKDALQTRTALVVGPSLAPDASTEALLKEVLSESPVPAVLDAGALSAMGTDYRWLRERPGETVLTPHPGEMARLLGTDSHAVQKDRVTAARRAAEQSGAVVILKGASTMIAAPDGRLSVLVAGNPGMAAGGMGDVLAGVVGSLLGQGVEAYLAACAGAELHARAGDHAAALVSEPALTPEDVLTSLGPVLLQICGTSPR